MQQQAFSGDMQTATSLASILGALPLDISQNAVPLSRQALGAAFAGQHVPPSALALFAADAAPAPLATSGAEDSTEDLVTPGAADAQAYAQQLPLSLPALPPLPQQCAFCGSLGTQALCGPLMPANIDCHSEYVHHLCAIWSPAVYQPQGSSAYVNLDTEVKRALQRSCNACGQKGAAIACAHPGCRNAFHLPCALGAPNIVLDQETFELWCPHHGDMDNSDEEYLAARPRRQTGTSGSSGKRQRMPNEAQRPRTDWQKRDDNTWLKVVPPWWCEHRTVHFATKVYRELFKSASSAILVDPQGGEWLCLVQMEARNDLRPQYTLRGAFADLWAAQSITAGETLVFRRDPITGRIHLKRLGADPAVYPKCDEAAGSELSDPSFLESAGLRPQRVLMRQEANLEHARSLGHGQQGSHPNRWMETANGWSMKTVYKSTLAHQQCPIAGWLFKKLYGRLPGEVDCAVMYDPDLEAEFRFDVNFLSAANVHYITGKSFATWMRESGLQAGEQIRIKRDSVSVVIQRVPFGRQARGELGARAPSRSVSLAGGADAAVAGMPASHGQEIASPPPADALDALDALVAAAGYAGTHGTPALQAALAEMTHETAVQAQAQEATQAPPEVKRRRTGQSELPSGIADGMADLEQFVVLTRRQSMAEVNLRPAACCGDAQQTQQERPLSLAPLDERRGSKYVAMYQGLSQALDSHTWGPEEQADLLCFRAKYAWLDNCGREVVYLTVTTLQSDKPQLLAYARAVAQGILAVAPRIAEPAAEAQLPGATALPKEAPALDETQAGLAPVSQNAKPAASLQTSAKEPSLLLANPALEATASFNYDLLLEASGMPQSTASFGPAM